MTTEIRVCVGDLKVLLDRFKERRLVSSYPVRICINRTNTEFENLKLYTSTRSMNVPFSFQVSYQDLMTLRSILKKALPFYIATISFSNIGQIIIKDLYI